MRPTLITALALCALLTPTTSAPASDAFTQDIFVRDDTASIIGTFTDAYCLQNQRDDSGAVLPGERTGQCKELPGQSMRIWWIKKNCYGEFDLFGGVKDLDTDRAISAAVSRSSVQRTTECENDAK